MNDEPTIIFGTAPIEEGGDGYPDGMPLLEALLAAKLERDARRAAEAIVKAPDSKAP